jgi:hypothetical protein
MPAANPSTPSRKLNAFHAFAQQLHGGFARLPNTVSKRPSQIRETIGLTASKNANAGTPRKKYQPVRSAIHRRSRLGEFSELQ